MELSDTDSKTTVFNNIYQGQTVKASACNAGDLGSIHGSGRCPGDGNGKPRQFSSTLAWEIPWMEEPHRLLFLGGRKEQNMTERLHFHLHQGLANIVFRGLKSIHFRFLQATHLCGITSSDIFFKKEQLSKIKFPFTVGQHCFIHTSNRPKKQEATSETKKNPQKTPFIFGLSSHLRQTNYILYS